MPAIPGVKVLEAIKPDNAGMDEDALRYSGLMAAAGGYALTNFERAEAFFNSEPDSLDELSAGRALASEYLVRTAARLVDSHVGNRDLWASRYTQASIELYGEPEKATALGLLSSEYRLLQELRDREGVSEPHVEYLLDLYSSLLGTNRDAAETVLMSQEEERLVLEAFGAEMRNVYQPLFEMVDQYAGGSLTPIGLHELFTSARNWLQENDDQAWGQWAVLFSEGTSLSVNSSSRAIKIASRREPASLEEARGLVAHELLVHALRGKNGHRMDDRKLATGLPDNLDAEEGLGVLAEAAISGKLPSKVGDRYTDIALALGVIDGRQRSRSELFKIAYARQLVREQLNGSVEIDQRSLIARVSGHVDRIYRGGPGDDIGSQQGIFTKDIAYYVGYHKMARYVAEQLEKGVSIIEIFAFLSMGKFDPTNPDHIERLKRARINRDLIQ